ncbi:MAG TPA: sugar phosphate nucleotidyltransferase [Elusimicrobiales bacterium]|nr:sugar phosphate nucleotidyltransferase [Elusimicrobiales bacterium]HPO94645.1 sugar phosphate nucleotidyltransferase [Elusimicrobiales bacterium]
MSDIIAGIFAAGKGERLKKDFPDTPKPLIKVGEKTLIEYALDNLLKLNPKDFEILLNPESGPKIIKYLKEKKYSFKYVMFDSKTSFESFYTLSNFLKEKDKTVILSTVDTILNHKDLKELLETHIKNKSYMTLGITEEINDEKPLLVEIDKNSETIKSIGKSGHYATNGIYVLSHQAITDIKPQKFKALREFLSSIDFEKLKVTYHIIKESLDIDEISDIELAFKKIDKF